MKKRLVTLMLVAFFICGMAFSSVTATYAETQEYGVCTESCRGIIDPFNDSGTPGVKPK